MKSLTTDEIELNDALAAGGVHAIETDFAELILQLDGDWSSHILVPAIHRNRTEIRDLFARTIAPGIDSSDDPRDLAEAARVYLREKFLTREGRRQRRELRRRRDRHGLRRRVRGQRPHVHDAAAGARDRARDREARADVRRPRGVPAAAAALVDRRADEPVHVALDRRRPPGDGPQEFHVVLLDNGRTRVLADEVGRQALHCIRCSACLNVCPVYSRTGGHAYGSVYPGPDRRDPDAAAASAIENAPSLPFASSLCGACYEVCPVKIDIPTRAAAPARGGRRAQAGPRPERAAMRALAWVFGSAASLRARAAAGRVAQRPFAAGDPAPARRRSRAGRGRATCSRVATRDASATGGAGRERGARRDPRRGSRRAVGDGAAPEPVAARPTAVAGTLDRDGARRALLRERVARLPRDVRRATSAGAIARARSPSSRRAGGSASRRACPPAWRPAGRASRTRPRRRTSSTRSTACSPAARVAIAETGHDRARRRPARGPAGADARPRPAHLRRARQTRSSRPCRRRSTLLATGARAAPDDARLGAVGDLGHRAEPRRGRARPAAARRPRRRRLIRRPRGSRRPRPGRLLGPPRPPPAASAACRR